MYIDPKVTQFIYSLELGELYNHTVNISNRTEIQKTEILDVTRMMHVLSFVEENIDWYCPTREECEKERERVYEKLDNIR